MATKPAPSPQPLPLRILHCLRAPLGGLFRHVCDLAEGQASRGHQVGILCDAKAVSDIAETRLAALSDKLALGVHRIAIPRLPGPGDALATLKTSQVAATLRPDVLHGHGAKGGAYARLAFRQPGASGLLPIRVYTPHGGSLHYSQETLVGRAFLGLERLLLKRTDLILFESAYSHRTYEISVTECRKPSRIVHNGIGGNDLLPVQPQGDANDLVFIGEMRTLKGVDVLIEAVAACHRQGQHVTLSLVGQGPDTDQFRAQVENADLSAAVRFHGPLPARDAFKLGRIAVVPSRAESLPYIVLELAGAGVPMIATDVGGIGEIFGPAAKHLIVPGNAEILTQRIRHDMANLTEARQAADRLRTSVARRFSLDAMVDGVLSAYHDAGAMGAG